MKKILLSIIFCFFSVWLSAQFIYKIKADSVLITNDSCKAELIIENSTKHVLGFLYNKGNGRTEFRTGSAIGDFILNQNSTNQSARMWVTGQIRTDSTIRMGQLTSDPSGANGMIYYNSTNNRFKGYRTGGWEDFLTSGNIAGSNGLLYNTSTNKIELGGLGHYDGRLTRDTYINTYDGTTDRKLIINTGTAPNNGGLFLQIDRTHGAMFRAEANGFNTTNSLKVLRVGNYDENGNDANESNNTSDLTTQEIFNNGWGTNGSFKGLLVRLNGSNQNNNYGLTGIEINTRHHYTSTSNVNGTAKNTALKLTANSVGAQGWLQALTYALYVDSGRVYSRDSVMFGTTTPGAFFHVNGTSRFDLGSDATGDIFYRNSSGQFTRLPVGSSGQVLTVSSGLPSWTTLSSNPAYSTAQENGSNLTQRSTINLGYGVTATDNSGSTRTDVDVDLTNSETFLTSDVGLSANTFSDAVSLSLAAGTWLVSGTITVESPNNTAQRVTFKFWDGSTVYQAGEASSNSMGSSTKGYVCLSVSSLVVLSGTTAVKVSIASTAASSIKATPGDNNSGTTNKASSLRAVRIK